MKALKKITMLLALAMPTITLASCGLDQNVPADYLGTIDFDMSVIDFQDEEVEINENIKNVGFSKTARYGGTAVYSASTIPGVEDLSYTCYKVKKAENGQEQKELQIGDPKDVGIYEYVLKLKVNEKKYNPVDEIRCRVSILNTSFNSVLVDFKNASKPYDGQAKTLYAVYKDGNKEIVMDGSLSDSQGNLIEEFKALKNYSYSYEGIDGTNYSNSVPPTNKGKYKVTLSFEVQDMYAKPVVEELTAILTITDPVNTPDENYSVSYVSTYGTAPQTVTNATEITSEMLPTLPNVDGFTFIGWYLDAACTQDATVGAISSSVILYAKWQAVLPSNFGFTTSDLTATPEQSTDLEVVSGITAISNGDKKVKIDSTPLRVNIGGGSVTTSNNGLKFTTEAPCVIKFKAVSSKASTKAADSKGNSDTAGKGLLSYAKIIDTNENQIDIASDYLQLSDYVESGISNIQEQSLYIPQAGTYIFGGSAAGIYVYEFSVVYDYTKTDEQRLSLDRYKDNLTKMLEAYTKTYGVKNSDGNTYVNPITDADYEAKNAVLASSKTSILAAKTKEAASALYASAITNIDAAKASTATGYTVTYVSAHGTAPTALQNVEELTETMLTRMDDVTGYEFKGWYLDEEFTQAASAGAISANTTLYAKWEAVSTLQNFGFTVSDLVEDKTGKTAEFTIVNGITALPDPSKGINIDGTVLRVSLSAGKVTNAKNGIKFTTTAPCIIKFKVTTTKSSSKEADSKGDVGKAKTGLKNFAKVINTDGTQIAISSDYLQLSDYVGSTDVSGVEEQSLYIPQAGTYIFGGDAAGIYVYEFSVVYDYTETDELRLSFDRYKENLTKMLDAYTKTYSKVTTLSAEDYEAKNAVLASSKTSILAAETKEAASALYDSAITNIDAATASPATE